jgi:2-dehydro-3-deoxyphosphogluconate aldolase/(4S)-4-hydroxy-2-oxoglutarate aldolase
MESEGRPLNPIFNSILHLGIVPIVRVHTAGHAIEAIDAIRRGGIPIAEITMTVPGALLVLETLASRFGDTMILGAGTVLDPETARHAILAGAQFLVTPSLNPAVIEVARRYSKPIFPGALTSTEVVTAWEAGADAVKIFPVSNLGGPKYIQALKGPLPQIHMVPTGGVNLENIAGYFRAGASVVAVGSELVDAATVRQGRCDVIEARAVQYAAAVAAARATN